MENISRSVTEKKQLSMQSNMASREMSSFWQERDMTYQEIKGVKHDMDERVLIKEVLEELKK